MSASTQRSYEFGSAAEDHTVVLGLRAGQLAAVAGSLVLAVLAVRVQSGPAGFAVAAATVALAAVVAFWPVKGRTPERWLPTLARWASRRLTRRDTYIAETPLLGHDSTGELPQRPPDTLAGVRILSAPLEDAGGRRVGIVHDRRIGTFGVALAVRGGSFQLADTPEKQRRLANWGTILAGLARGSSPIHRIQWVERTVPEDGDAMARYLAETAHADAEHPSRGSYESIVTDAGPSAPRHETYLVVSISARRARTAIRQAGGGERGAVEVLLRELRSLNRQLRSAEITVDGVLTPRLLAGVVRTAFDPDAQEGLAHRAAADGGEQGCPPAHAWPLATETTWAAYRTADAWHATYWIAQWPRTPVGPDFLVPLLLGTSGMRTVAVTMEPVSPLRAHRDVEQALLKQSADEELRARAGFMGSARRRRAQETVARREEELADGHADYRLSGYVTVTADTPQQLEARCGEVEQLAHQASLDLQRLYGHQDVAFTFTLPLARGLGGRP